MTDKPHIREESAAVIRFAGDSGDGMQLTGGQFTLAAVAAGNALATFPDFPAEIRAPAGSIAGVSAFQIQFGATDIRTVGDSLDVLAAMNPAALKVCLPDLKPGGMLILDADAFTARNLRKAGYDADPRQDGSLARYRLLQPDIGKLTRLAVSESGATVTGKEGGRARNLWALGLALWMFARDIADSETRLRQKFAATPEILAANLAALKAGFAYGETSELPADITVWRIPGARRDGRKYRNITGAEALAFGLMAGCARQGRRMTFCSYPITPASQLLHFLAKNRLQGTVVFQAEDEIAAICAALGASWTGALGVTASSGPGMALKTEALGLAAACELPLLVVNAQRGGPSTGLPTKTEQSDLLQAVWGRNADTPMPVLAAATAADCFDTAVEAARLAVKYMTPVILLTDGYLQNASEPWIPPEQQIYAAPPAASARTGVTAAMDSADGVNRFRPYLRDPETLARPWATPGMPGLMHRIGGLERADGSGAVSYDPDNHRLMTRQRRDKILGIARDIPPQTVACGGETGKLAIIGWGSTFGPILQAVENLNARGGAVSHIHLRHIWPQPGNLAALLQGFQHALVAEMNDGQLLLLLRALYPRRFESLTKVAGRPFTIGEIEQAALALLNGENA